MLSTRTYDVVLCQPFLGPHGLRAYDVLKAVRQDGQQNDVPFICCQSESDQLTGAAGVEIASTIRTMGGQGLIEHEVFQSKNLIHAISKCLTAAVGSRCVTSAWR